MYSADFLLDYLARLGHLNQSLHPFSLILPWVFALAVMAGAVAALGKRRCSPHLLSLFAVSYVLQGIILFALHCRDGAGLAFLELSIFLFIAGVLFCSRRRVEFFRRPKSAASLAGLIIFFCGIFVYPLLERLSGLEWPGMVFFGTAECPTTTALIGLLITAYPQVWKPLYFGVMLLGIFSGFSAVLAGFPLDLLYGGSATLGLVLPLLSGRERA